ncbi:MAG: hypothetical protein GY712_09570 [Oceanicoccus sp.]|nr:hypothetical protein [Oceanicoccus sp.]
MIDSTGTVGIGTTFPASSAQLEVNSTTKGLLPPRMTETQRDGISSPAAGLLIFQTDGIPGYYYYSGTDWIGITGDGPGAISASSVIDCDGNTYPTITIGNQVWMAENLRVTHYKNGDAIPRVWDAATWEGLSTGAWCSYRNLQSNFETYGALYNWYAVDDSRGLCPEGWRVPTAFEIITLADYLGGTSVAGGKMKATSDLWNSPNTDATNSSSFSGLPGGFCTWLFSFDAKGIGGYWWSSVGYSSTQAWFWNLYSGDGDVVLTQFEKRGGFSVRCLRD